MIVTGTYDPHLVALSILVACFASYTALDLSGHVPAARGRARAMWLAAAAITMGGGIWSMHFVAMLAFMMSAPMSYDIGLTAISLLVAILVTGGGFYVISRHNASLLHLVVSGLFMGLGIAAMHYIGMAAMRGPVELRYDPLIVALSIAVAICASTVALWLAFRTADLGQMLAAAVVMGLAVSGMHYTGMRAATFTAHGSAYGADDSAGLDQTNLALAVAGTTFVILVFASAMSLFERKRAGEALHQAQLDLARVARLTTLGELTSSIAHEVRQPLAAIITDAQAGLRWLSHGTPNLDEVRQNLERIIKNGQRAGDVIQHVRALATRTDTQRTPLDVNDVITEAIALVRREVYGHDVALGMEFTPALPPVLADRIQLQQVVINLVINGVEAMQSITDRPRELLIRSHQGEREQVLVTVKDCGTGIPSEDMDRLFDAFFTTKSSGMGMGLSICRSIIEAHGGRLSVSSNDGPGATFQFALPGYGKAGS